MGKRKLHGVKSHRDQREVPDGTNYEATEGARTGSDVRETKCRVWSNCGGAAVRTPTLTSVGREFSSSINDGCSAGSKGGVESVK